MTNKVRGAQLIRKLCQPKCSAKDCATQQSSSCIRPDGLVPQSRSFAAQPARDLASDSAYEPAPEQVYRSSQHQAHQYLWRTLQGALSEAHTRTLPGASHEQQKAESDRILRQFAPIDLMLRSADDEMSRERLRMLDKFRQQLQLEWNTVQELRMSYVEHAKDMMKMGRGGALKGSQPLMQKWFPGLRDAIEAEQLACARGEKGVDRTSYGPYLYALDPGVLAVLTMHGALGTMLTDDEAGRVKLTRVAVGIGKMVNEQIGTENMKRRVDLENKRQRQMMKMTEAMWADYRDCQQRGYDWAPRRAKWESHLKELQALRGMYSGPRALLRPAQTPKPIVFSESSTRSLIGKRGRQLRNDDLYTQAMTKLQKLEKEAGMPPAAAGDAQEPATEDWFKADPKYESRLKDIRKRWHKLHLDTGTLSEVEKKMALGTEVWGSNMVVKVGAVLCKLLMDSAKLDVVKSDANGNQITVQEPAFQHELIRGFYDDKGKGWWKKFGMVSMHDSLMDRLTNSEVANSVLPRWMPMLIPAKPWTAPNVGGQLSHSALIMRVRGCQDQIRKLFHFHRDGKLAQVYEALNAMGETAWGINPIILERIRTAYTDMKGGFCGLPLHDNVPTVPLPPKPSQVFRTDVSNSGQLTVSTMDRSKREMNTWRSEVQKSKKKARELYSLRCDMQHKMNVAEKYLHEDAFYFPHNLDFRGRAYPMHPNLNHLGADLSRGLLQFAEAKPLGANGLRWLEISVATLYGQGADKLPFDDRVQFAREHMFEILDAAEHPFDGTGWWQSADSPWQLLAVCCDLKAALDSGNPATYCSKIPIHQDGSCNGLQHYAALARDESGGRAVNLLPVDKPQDVYTEIAKLVQQKVDADQANGVPEAMVLRDNVDRKLVKQTVMTSVYGVTFVGARSQIGNRLSERGWDDERLIYKTSCYGARVTLSCLHEMFTSAKDIMQWLGTCARVVARADNAVQWTTPLGLPVVQPYRKKSKTHVQTLLQRVILVHHKDDSPIQKTRQKSAFPPNFIHSIDSSHMMLTAIACHRAGLSFAGVHDSFWTHAGDVDQMNHILREKFHELHKQPLLENLRAELQELHPDLNIPAVPKRGALDLDRIFDAQYFFN